MFQFFDYFVPRNEQTVACRRVEAFQRILLANAGSFFVQGAQLVSVSRILGRYPVCRLVADSISAPGEGGGSQDEADESTATDASEDSVSQLLRHCPAISWLRTFLYMPMISIGHACQSIVTGGFDR